jgi:hypothetical protein
VKYFVANPQSAGVGVDGLQLVCSSAAFYSHNHSLILRMQSEDRTNRIGSVDTSIYTDFIARNSIDVSIARSIKNKKNLSEFTLNDLVQQIKEL